MKIAVSAQGTDMNSPVDPRFGRAAHFVIYDTETKNFEVLSNGDNAAAAQGAGIQAAQMVADQAVDMVVSGNMGPKAFQVLRAAGIKMVSWSDGTVQEAIDMIESGQYDLIDQANVGGHWK
ncbi:MAG TPA: NifB/NifX family molybdenum-iron cluster-binding protein [candidate division Zixibacteria bacterium]|nr:NifB/NifX family molybdenum-iron cluster-binding protein [candidate division Zixibacteria bacterium]